MRFICPEDAGPQAVALDKLLLSSAQIIGVSKSLNSIYIAAIDHCADRLESVLGIGHEAAKVISRRSLVPLLHALLTRLYRLALLLQKRTEALCLPVCTDYAVPATIENFHAWVTSSPDFNQYLLSEMAEIFDLSLENPGNILVHEEKQHRKFRNNLFDIRKKSTLWSKIFRRIQKELEGIVPWQRFPILTFANAEFALQRRWLYLTTFKRIPYDWQLPEGKVNSATRDAVFSDELWDLSTLQRLFEAAKLDKMNEKKIAAALTKHVKKFFPIQFLENLRDNLRQADAYVSSSKKKVLFSSGDGDTRSTLIVAAAKQRGYRIIKAQHGGHYGYYRDFSAAFEVELPEADEFFTWGWTRFPDDAQLQHITTTPMPSPWLSERKIYWQGFEPDTGKEYDVLFMPNMMKRFVPPPQGGSAIRRDVMPQFHKEITAIVRSATAAGISVYCKPFNSESRAIMASTFDALPGIGGDLYTECDHYEKGLTRSLVDPCRLVLWDQPGTGFLECLVCGVPTMAFWSRLYCEEEEWTKAAFKEMENAGLIHDTVESLIPSLIEMKKFPLAWINNPERKAAIHKFCDQYAKSDANWWKIWKTKLKTLEAA